MKLKSFSILLPFILFMTLAAAATEVTVERPGSATFVVG